MPLKSAIHLRLKEAGEFLHNKVKEKDDGKDKYKFEYLQDGKIVKISAVSENIISQVIA